MVSEIRIKKSILRQWYGWWITSLKGLVLSPYTLNGIMSHFFLTNRINNLSTRVCLCGCIRTFVCGDNSLRNLIFTLPKESHGLSAGNVILFQAHRNENICGVGWGGGLGVVVGVGGILDWMLGGLSKTNGHPRLPPQLNSLCFLFVFFLLLIISLWNW